MKNNFEFISTIEGNGIVPNGKKIVTVNENGIYHTYIEWFPFFFLGFFV